MVRGETGAVSGVKLLQLHFPRGTTPLSSPLLSLQGEAALKAAFGWNWFAYWAQTFRTWIVNNYPFQSRAIHRKVVVCSLPLKLSENRVTNLSIVDLLCLLRLLHRKMFYILNVKAIKALFRGASGLRLFQSVTFYQVRFVIAAWQYEWCILSQLAQWRKIFINGDKLAGFNQKWGSIVLGHIDTNIARQDISDIYLWYKYSGNVNNLPGKP